MNHPLPWSVRPEGTPETTRENYIQSLWIADCDGKCVVRVTECSHGSATPEQRELAAFIVDSANRSSPPLNAGETLAP